MSAVDTLSRLAATFFGAGYSPFAPGTAGSIAALPLYLLFVRLPLRFYLMAVAAVTLIGVFASTKMEAAWGKDPSRVVVDEVAGTLITLVSRPRGVKEILIGLILFRFFDIVKPPPVRTMEALPGGIGIMADDVAAGILSALALAGVRKAMKKVL